MGDPVLSLKSLRDVANFGGAVATGALANSSGRLTQAGVDHLLKMCEALWIHSGDPKDPHAELTSGKCSNGFVDVLRALRHTAVSNLLAYHMVQAIDRALGDTYEGPYPDWVIGSDHAGATFSHDVARWFGAMHDFTEKGPNKTQVWKRFAINPGEAVLQMEELMTTAGTMLEVREGIRAGSTNPVTFVPVVGVLVHRSGVNEIEGAPVVFLAHYDIAVWEPDTCPLCAAGSERIRPKQNWAKLTGKG